MYVYLYCFLPLLEKHIFFSDYDMCCCEIIWDDWRGSNLAGHPVLTPLFCSGLRGFLVPKDLPDAKQSLRLGRDPVPEVMGVSGLCKQL